MESKIGPAHWHPEPGRVSESKLGDDVIGHTGRGGGGQGNPAGFGMPGPEGGQAEIVLAEGMAPLANAMGLVHSNGPNGHGPAGRLEGRLSEPFGGNEEKPTRAVLEAGQGALDLFGVKARGDGHRCDAGLFQSFHLIGHQGDQGADDETDPAPV